MLMFWKTVANAVADGHWLRSSSTTAVTVPREYFFTEFHDELRCSGLTFPLFPLQVLPWLLLRLALVLVKEERRCNYGLVRFFLVPVNFFDRRGDFPRVQVVTLPVGNYMGALLGPQNTTAPI